MYYTFTIQTIIISCMVSAQNINFQCLVNFTYWYKLRLQFYNIIYPINSKCNVDSSSQSAIIHIKLKKHMPTDKENIFEQSIPDLAFMR